MFASIVFAYHLLILALQPSEESSALWAALAELSIQGFFVVSGALVYGSLLRTPNIGLYAEKRIRRLYPAYAVIILVPAIYALMKTGAYAEVGKYLAANLTFQNYLHPTLPGLFEGHREPAVNGALWTLKIEVMFYILLPLLGWLVAKSGRAVVLIFIGIYVGAEIWRAGMEWLALRPHEAGEPADELYWRLARQLPGQLSFFVSGMALWMLRETVRKYWFLALILGAGLVIGSYTPSAESIRAAGLGLLVGGLAYAPGPTLNAARYGDISYGVYITHFPIVQALVACGLFAVSQTAGIFASIVLVIVFSFVLWRVIERPMLRRDSHYRQAESTTEK